MDPLKVIFVEDSEDDLILMLRALKKAGYEPCYTRVETHEGLREALSDKKWQLVISDHSMPAYSAPEALRTLQESNRSLPFIIVSGTIDDIFAASIIANGANDYIDKANLSALGPAIKRLLH